MALPGVPSGAIRRNRANIEPGQTAFVGDLRFGPGQLLPAGTAEYQVTGFYLFDAESEEKFGVSGFPYSFTVAVGTSKKDIQDLLEGIADEVTEEGDLSAAYDRSGTNFLWYTMGL